jgi:hypothetical protein
MEPGVAGERWGLWGSVPPASRELVDMWWLLRRSPSGRSRRVADTPLFFFSSPRSSFRARDSSSG